MNNSPMVSQRNANLDLDKRGFRSNKENEDIVSIMLKQAYTVDSDVTWSRRLLKKEQRCKSMLATIKMTPKLILDRRIQCDTGLMKGLQCVLGPHIKPLVVQSDF